MRPAACVASREWLHTSGFTWHKRRGTCSVAYLSGRVLRWRVGVQRACASRAGSIAGSMRMTLDAAVKVMPTAAVL